MEVNVYARMIGKNIRRIRKKYKKKINTVSNDTGIPKRDLIRLESGFGGDLDPKYLLVFEKYYNVDFSEFFKGI